MQTLETLSKHLFLFIFLTLMACCSPEERLSMQLDDIEQQIPLNTNRAKVRLDSLYAATPQLFATPYNQARYILLDTYCNYRTNQEGSNDSLISVAEEYLLPNGTIRQKILCHLLHGVILDNANNNGLAMIHFQKAAIVGEGSDEHFLLGQVYCQMSRFCNSIDDYDCQKYALKALHHYSLHGNELYIEDAHYFVGLSLWKNQQYDSCWQYVKRNLERAELIVDKYIKWKNTRLLAMCELHLNQYDSAWVHIMDLREKYRLPFNYVDYNLLAQISAKMKRKSLAYQYLDSAQTFNNYIYQRLTNYLSQAFTYHDLGEDDKAYHCYHQYQSLRDTLSGIWSDKKVMVEQRDFVAQQLTETKMRNTILKYRLTSIILVLLMFLTSLVFKFYKDKIKRRHLQEINRLLDEQVRQMELNKQQAIFCIKQTEPVQHFKAALQGEGKATPQDWQNLDNIFHELLPQFREILMENSELNEIDWKICQLQKLDFSNSEIALLVNRAPSSVSSASARLCQKVLQRDGGAAEWSKYIHSI